MPPSSRLTAVTPFFRAYALGFLSSTGPRLINVLASLARGKIGALTALQRIIEICRQALELNRFPAFCGALVGGSTLLQIPFRIFLNSVVKSVRCRGSSLDYRLVGRTARILASLVSASVSFQLLNRTSSDRPQHGAPPLPQAQIPSPSVPPEQIHIDPFEDPPETPLIAGNTQNVRIATMPSSALSGRTMDLTLFAAVRALDIVIGSIWTRYTSRTKFSTRVVSRAAPPALFCFSAITIMHAWFYAPSRLPRAYNSWISAAAELDRRLLGALRHARYGTFVYGKDTGMAPLLGSMCKDYNLPEEWGDPKKTIPVPCELVHMGCGRSCEKHAFIRFCRGWAFAAKMYGPLQLLVLLRNIRAGSQRGRKINLAQALKSAVVDMTRSSAFLGFFISLFYYGVCLSRTRLGPQIFSPKTVTPQMWDSGLCVLAGCVLCGTSILVEQIRKQQEILFFVLPRAAAAWFPRRYLVENRWKEHAAFAISTAIVFSAVQEDPRKVRGVLGTILHGVLKSD